MDGVTYVLITREVFLNSMFLLNTSVKAHTHRAIFRGFRAESAVESVNSIPESADYTTDSVIVG